MQRRDFLSFLGRATAIVSVAPAIPLHAMADLASSAFQFKPLTPQTSDQLVLAEGFQSEILLKWQDKLTDQLEFGTNCDYLAFFPEQNNPNAGTLWVNHEYYSPSLVSGYTGVGERTEEQWKKEFKSVGGSLVRIEKHDGAWKYIPNHKVNARYDGFTNIPIMADRKPEGGYMAKGTFGNCAGGVTPWGTVLTCEEGYQAFYGEVNFNEEGERSVNRMGYRWDKYYNCPPEHYGWVVEINPETGQAMKHFSMGRFQHECASVADLGAGMVAVYSGDDDNDEHLYKFINDQANSLISGKLYVANLEEGKWVSLNWEEQPILQERFKDQTEVQIRCKEAAKLLGATPLDRPEDIEIDPLTGAIFVSCTNNKPKGNFYGSLLKIEEKEGNDGLSFNHEYWKFGGEEEGFACPDNLAFDRNGNLWLTTDISGSSIEKGPYKGFGNNSLFVIPAKGEKAGKPIRVATAPKDAELTGPFFAPDKETLFLSVQHPGEQSSEESYTSNWPEGGNAMPKSSVVCISGPEMKKILK